MGLITSNRYRQMLDVRKTQDAIPKIKTFFQARLAESLNLIRASAPLIVKAGTGINDDLNGTEKKVSFNIKDDRGAVAEVVNSLAKWKRMALAKYERKYGEGIWTDMNALRPDEDLDNLHSLYVDQWDWERVISREERTEVFLRSIVEKIYDAIKETEIMVQKEFGIPASLPSKIGFVTTQELEDAHPHTSIPGRENLATKNAGGAVFIMKIGGKLMVKKDCIVTPGKPHDGRAPDYDDWNLNGDIVVWNNVLNRAFELSSMGIRVDKESLVSQLKEAGAMDRLELEFHKKLVNDELPLSIGGGIGQSRLSMLLLRKIHIGEVQASIWPDEMLADLAKCGIHLL
ncbi:MAG: aspartate--ammonia ligase [Candidatus Micrarchaeota archaeon]